MDEILARGRTAGESPSGWDWKSIIFRAWPPGRRVARALPFDFLIHSVHFVDGFAIDLNAGPWEGLPQEERDRVWRVYWEYPRGGRNGAGGHHRALRPAEEVQLLSFGRPDCRGPGGARRRRRRRHGHRNQLFRVGQTGRGVPRPLHQEARRREIPLVITADAHEAGDIARHFDRARLLAADAGYTELVRFERRTRIPYPL